MRLSRITCCTISALLGSGVAAQANDGINEHQPQNTDLDQQPDLNYAHPSDKYQVAVAVVPSTASRIVPPEISLNHLETRHSNVELANVDLAAVAIAPRANAAIDKVVREIDPQASGFVSEFEWTANENVATETAQVPVLPEVVAEDATAIAPEPNPAPAAASRQELPENYQTVITEPPPLITASTEARDLLIKKNVEPPALNANKPLTQRVLSRPMADFMDAETETERGAIAALPETIEANIETETETDSSYLISQNSRNFECESCTPVEPLVLPEVSQGVSPGLSIAIPVGFGADQNTVFLSSSYQAVTRTDGYSTFHSGLGVGLGNASETVGVELSYTLDTNDSFGDGGFNAKLHKRFSPDFAGSIGWNGFLNTSRHDFEHSLYGSLTKVFRTRESLDESFSRIAVTAGLGSNQFRSDAAVRAGNNDINAFGNIAIRVARPVSFITEWSGQDLGVGLSIAPFKNVPLVITPAIRDIFDGHGSRLVVGIGLAKKF